MDAYEQLLDGVQWVLDHCTSYQVAKDLGINNRTINRYQNGTSPVEKMSLNTAKKIYSYYMEVVKVGEKVDVYTEEYYLGKEMDASEIIMEYPFLKDKNLNSAVITIKGDEISLGYKEDTGSPVVAWKRNQMTGNWIEIMFKH